MKPLGFKNYGSIPHLSSSKLGKADKYIEKGQERILTEAVRDKHDVVIVLEKYDGSNVGIAKVNGEIVALTRSGYLACTSPYKQHHLFSDWVDRNKSQFDHELKEGERICGEWLAQVHSLEYTFIDRSPIVLFDWFDSNNKRKPFLYLVVSSLFHYAARVLHEGNSITPDALKGKLSQGDECCYTKNPEGMVYRLERKRKVDFLAKWVRQDFEPGKYCIGTDEKDLKWNIKF